jgi:hypothetical protein
MPAATRKCHICRKPFRPSRFRPSQSVCSSPDCQRRRQTEYHRDKCRDDPEYCLVCRDSNQKWRERNRDYQRRYRQDHPAYVELNRRQQRRRDRRRRMRHLVKNNLAISEVMIFQTVSASVMPPDASCKEHPAVFPSTGDP